MSSKKISELTAASVLGGGELLAGVQSGANVAVTPDQIAAHASKALSRPPRIAFAGDSIAKLFGGMYPESPWFWSLAQVPRVLDYPIDGNTISGNFAVDGSGSGDLWSGAGRTGTKLYTAGASDLTQGPLTKLKAYAPDILFLEIGVNDPGLSASAALDATFLNVRDVYTALLPFGLKHFVVCSVLPTRNYGVQMALSYNQQIRQWARETPGVHVLDFAAYMVDDADADGIPIGGTAGATGAMTRDGLHPSATFGRVAAPAVTAMLDNLHIARAMPRGVSQNEVYNATTAPGGNLLGTKGAMVGAYAGSVGGGASGSMATGWYGSTGHAELTAVFSKGTLVDRRGQSHVAQIITLGTTGANLTANRSVQFFTPLGAFPPGKRLTHQALAQFANLVGCDEISISFQANAGTAWSTSFGVAGTFLPAFDFPTSATVENIDLVNPVAGLPDAGTTGLQLVLEMYFRSGTKPAGTVAFAQAGAWAEVTLP